MDKTKFVKYSGLAFQLLFYILIGYFIGNFIDKKLNNPTPYCTAFSSIVFLSLGLYSIIKDVLNSK